MRTGVLTEKKQCGGLIRRFHFFLPLICLIVLIQTVAAPLSVRAEAGQPDVSGIRDAFAAGRLIFDGADLFTQEEESALSDRAEELSRNIGFSNIIFTTAAFKNFQDAEDLADYLYYEGNFGTGEEHSGVLFLIDMHDRSWYIYTKGAATRYLTDSALGYMENDIVPALSEGEYALAADAFLTDAEGYYDLGVQPGQYDYNTQTGEKDYADVGGKRLSLWKIALSALFAGLIAYLPCRSVRKSYAMEAERKMAQGFALAYRADARFQFGENTPEARLIDKHVTSIPIPRVRNSGQGRGFGGGFPGGSFGGGGSTLSGGRGGSFHGGRGGKF